MALVLLVLPSAFVGVSTVPTSGAGFSGTTANASNTWQTGTFSSCPVRTIGWLSGFESGVISSAGATATAGRGLLDSVTANTTPEATVVRTGDYSLKVNKVSGAAHFASKANLGSPAGASARFAVRFDTLPTAASRLFTVVAAAGDSVSVNYDSANTRLTVSLGTSTASMSTTIATGRWYVVELNLDASTGTRTAKSRIDGTALTDLSVANTASTISSVRLGSDVSTEVYTAFYDDVVVTTNAAQHPLGDGRILSLAPNEYVSKSDAGGRMQNDGGTVVDSTSWQRIDEKPLTATADYIQQASADGAAYAEFGFENAPGSGCVNGVSAVVALHASATSANNAATVVREGTTDRQIHNDSIGSTALVYRSLAVAPESGDWTVTKLNATTARVGYSSDTTAVPFWDALRLEYELPPEALQPPTALSATMTCTPGTAATITYVGHATVVYADPATVSKPTNTAEGDVMVAHVAIRDNGDPTTVPSGWTKVGASATGISSFTSVIYTKVATASEPTSYTWAGPSGVKSNASIITYRGVDPATPVDAIGQLTNGASTSATAPSITTTVPNTVLLAYYAARTNLTATPPSGMTERYDLIGNQLTAYIWFSNNHQTLSASGATGTRISALSASSTSYGHAVALRPKINPPTIGASLSWTSSTSTWASGYRVQRAVGSTVQTTNTVTPVSATSYSDAGPLSHNTTYTYTVSTMLRDWFSTPASVDLAIGTPTC